MILERFRERSRWYQERQRRSKLFYGSTCKTGSEIAHNLGYFITISLVMLVIGIGGFFIDFSNKIITTAEYMAAYHLVKDHADGR